jgi:uncharacterized protein DUF2721
MIADTTVSTIAHLIQLSVAPVFLLTGVGSILSVLAARLGRIVDRARVLETNLPNAEPAAQTIMHLELSRLSIRAGLINWAISLCTICALLICTLIALLFVGDFITSDMANFVALLFITAMLTLIGGLLCFLREIYMAIKNLRIGLH